MIQPPKLATHLAFYPARDQCQLTPGPEFANSSFPSRLQPVWWFFTTQAMEKLSVNQTRGHSSHKWLLAFSTVGLCGNDLRSQIPFGWFPTVWISEPFNSVDTGFFAPTCLFKLGPPQVLYEPPRKATPSPSGNDQSDQVSRQENCLSTLNDSDGISGTT